MNTHATSKAVTTHPLDAYNVVWDSPSKDAHGSMPLGNGDIGINVWVELSGDIIFYISKTDAWDENGRLCKIGRVRLKFTPALNVTSGFRQELKLQEGRIEISGDGDDRVNLWVDANHPVIRVEAHTSQPVTFRAEVELWRLTERPFGPDDDGFSGRDLHMAGYKTTVLPDVVVLSPSPRIVWYHRNKHSIFPVGFKQQHLESLLGTVSDPILNRTFGASLVGTSMVRDGAKVLRSSAPAKTHSLTINVLTAKSGSSDAWLMDLEKQEKKSAAVAAPHALQAHRDWWAAFWQRSWVFLDGFPEAETITRGYVLQRFMDACGGRGAFPIKFNGSIFTVENQPGTPDTVPSGDPDWRNWGGNYWFQNTRLEYWPMLATGDFEMMLPWFRMYLDDLPLSKARVKAYYGFVGGAVYPETMYFWGLPNIGDWSWGAANVGPEAANPFIKRYWNGSLELTAMMLDYYDFTQNRAFAERVLVPLADPLIAFLDQYWKRDAKKKIRFDPAQSLETWHVAVNPLPEIAALRFLLPRLLTLPQDITTVPQRARWQRLLGELPPIPMTESDGVKRLSPAETFSSQSNSENPELYAVFPYRLYGVGRPDLKLARDTYERRGHRHNQGWCQDSIQAACLGLADEAGKLVAARAAQTNAYRFPVMWGPNFDWIPDQDHGNNILTTLHFMLLQFDNDRLYALPAWPKNWNVSFKLHAPHNTTVEGEYRNGKLEQLTVTPKSREKDIQVMLGK